LSGSIPSLTGLNSLTEYKVHTNALTGPLPSLAGLGSLRVIDVAHNQLSGAIPDAPSPNNLVAEGSALCPNDFSASSSEVWDAATHGAYRWSTACEHPIVVTPGSAPHGRIFPSTPQRIGFDETFTFDLEPDAGYGAAVSSNCAGGQYSAAGYSVTHIALIFIPPPGLSYGDCTVTPIFSNQRVNVTISSSAHGSVSPLGVQNLLFGSYPTMTIIPDAGYRPMVRSNCGATYPTTVVGTQWTLPEPVQQDCWIEVTFMREFTVTPIAGVHGRFSFPAPRAVLQGDYIWLEVVADPGYRVASVTGCGGAITYMYTGGRMANYRTGAINADCAVVAIFISLAEAAAQPVPVGGRYATPTLLLLLATTGAVGFVVRRGHTSRRKAQTKSPT